MDNNTSSDNIGNLPKESSEELKIFPNHSEINFVSFRKPAEKNPSHTLTIREVARIFEEQGAPITEHTVTNWCKQNSAGICRLDGYYDELERRWYITSESVELAINEERLRLRKDVPNLSETAKILSEEFGNIQNEPSESFRNNQKHSENTFRTDQINQQGEQKDYGGKENTHDSSNIDTQRISELEKSLLDMRILN